MKEALSMPRRISPLLLALIMVTFVLSLAFIYVGFLDYIGNRFESGSLNLTIGVTTLAISTYMLFQTKRRTLRIGFEMQPLNKIGRAHV